MNTLPPLQLFTDSEKLEKAMLQAMRELFPEKPIADIYTDDERKALFKRATEIYIGVVN